MKQAGLYNPGNVRDVKYRNEWSRSGFHPDGTAFANQKSALFLTRLSFEEPQPRDADTERDLYPAAAFC